MKKIYITLLLVIVLSACSTIVSNPTVMPTPTAIFRTPTPMPTISSPIYTYQLAADEFLFIELQGGIACSEKCECESEPAMPSYQFKDGKLTFFGWYFENQFDWRTTRNGAIGFYGYYSFWVESNYTFFSGFPFKTPDSNFIVNGIVSNNGISVKTSYGNVIVKVGGRIEEGWVEPTVNPECQFLHYSELVNHGVIKDDDVIIEEISP